MNIINNKSQKTINGHRNSVIAVVISHDSSKIVSGGQDSYIRIWDTKINTN